MYKRLGTAILPAIRKDLADRARVSPFTVSMVMNGTWREARLGAAAAARTRP
jgi:hypothetical protein